MLKVGAEAFGLEGGPGGELGHSVGLGGPDGEVGGVGGVGLLHVLDGGAGFEEEDLDIGNVLVGCVLEGQWKRWGWRGV